MQYEQEKLLFREGQKPSLQEFIDKGNAADRRRWGIPITTAKPPKGIESYRPITTEEVQRLIQEVVLDLRKYTNIDSPEQIGIVVGAVVKNLYADMDISLDENGVPINANLTKDHFLDVDLFGDDPRRSPWDYGRRGSYGNIFRYK